MRMGVHRDALTQSLADADQVYVLESKGLQWDPRSVLAGIGDKLRVESDVKQIVDNVLAESRSGDQIVMMSNGSFEGLPRLLQQAFKSAESLGATSE